MRTRVKICGITRIEDAQAAVAAGADAIGLVFYPPSPRSVSVDQAAAIVQALPPFVTATGLFVNELPTKVAEVLQTVPLDLLQFHGDETEIQCNCFGRPYIKAIRMREGVDLETEMTAYPSARGFLLDSYRKGVPGGTGDVFAWERIPQSIAREIILAGGLDPKNIGLAIGQVRPYAVDVSGGVEMSKSIKDAAKIAAFIRGVERADREANGQ